MAVRSIKIEVGGPEKKVSADTLAKVLQHTVSVLNRLSFNMTGERPEWIIKNIKMSSPVTISLQPTTDGGRGAISTMLKGFRKIEAGQRLPNSFDRDAVVDTKRLTLLSRNGLGRIRFSAHREGAVSLSEEIAPQIETVIETIGKPYCEWTTIEGTLEEISVHGGRSVFRIFRRIGGKGVDCDFDKPVLERVRDLSVKDLLPSRAQVYGRARFDREGNPVSMQVTEFKRLRPREELPLLRKMPPIDVTGGVDATEHLRKIRGDD